ncbi:unnamed protein product [Microthlaspi erraticum]|uniref:Uncharacterized protein n=1 Tax=Microthlaspi erraticum TaxID=1685480 RepID=A0A6D2JRA7_9BRAS|nr:unnamed protein product [Microthlaspi erraticum]
MGSFFLLLWLNLLHGSSWLLSCSLSQPTDSPLLLPLHSQSHHFLLHLESHSLLLNKVHSNLKLPLLTLTTNGSFLFLVLLSSLNLSLSDSPQSTHTPLHQTLPSLIILQIGLHLSLLSLALLDSPSTILLCEARFPHCLSSCYTVSSLKYLKCIKDYKELEL